MQDWRKLFDGDTLENGQLYYRMGKAKNLVEAVDLFEVTVRGSRNYKVKIITFFDERRYCDVIKNMYCTCESGQKGIRCKHMAAALYLIDAEYEIGADDALIRESGRRNDGAVETKQGDSAGNGNRMDDVDRKMQTGSAGNTEAVYRNHLLQEMDQLQSERHEEIAELEDTYSRESTEESRYFEYQHFHDNLGITKKLLSEAQDFAEKSSTDSITVRLFYGDYEMKGVEKLYGHSQAYLDPYTSCEIIFNKKGVVAASCKQYECMWHKKSTSQSRIGYVPCKHVTALILHTERFLKENNPGDDTNGDGMRFLSGMKDNGYHTVADGKADKGQTIRLEPNVKLSPDLPPMLSFRVGASKMYKVKRVNELIDKTSRHEEMRFGKNTVLMMGEEYYDEASLGWYRFIRALTEEEWQYRHQWGNRSRAGYYMDYIPELTDEIPLFGHRLDLFYDQMKDQQVSFEFRFSARGSNKKMLNAGEGRLEVSMEIAPYLDVKTHDFLGIQMTGKLPDMLEGEQYSYYVDDDHICRVDGEMARRLEPLTDIVHDGRVEVVIGRRHLADFYYKTLPNLKQFMTVIERDGDMISRHLPPKPEFICYFDVSDGMILCRAEAVYGQKIHSLYDYLEGNKIESYRDREGEERIVNCLAKYVENYDSNIPVLYTDRGENAVFELMTVGFQELMELCEVRVTERFKKMKLRSNFKVSVGVAVAGTNLLDLSIHSEELSDEELLEILEGYRARKKYYRLKNGDFISLEDNDTVEQLSDMMELMRIPLKQFVAGKMQLPAYRALYMDKMLEQTEGVYAERDQKFKRLVKEFKAVEDSDFEIPASLKKVLRKYQKVGYRWLRTLDQYGFGGILADEMGLGKTLQVIAVLLADKQEHTEEHHTSLIVCPASLVYNWNEELARFAPELDRLLVVGTKTEREAIIEKCGQADVVVTSYDLLKRDIASYEDKQFRFEIIDEAQMIKNQNTAAAKAVKLIQSVTRFALTGTPIENRLSELWSIFDYLMQGFLYDYQSFRQDMETPIVKNGNEEIRDRLRRMVAPFILRRRKQEVLKDLPDKLEEIRYAGMSEQQRKLYDGQVVRLQKLLREQSDDDYNKSRIQILAELTRIRQICCDPSLIFEDYNGESAKRDSLLELVEGIVEGEHKALIFSQFTSMFDIIEKELVERAIPYYKITGSTPKEKRVELVNAFNQNDVPIFLISLKAGGTGLNLTGADIVVHYDPWWNVAAQNQATDRAHRIGQTKVVTVYRLILKDTIEERIVEMQEAKQKLAEDILGGEAVGSARISREELLELLG